MAINVFAPFPHFEHGLFPIVLDELRSIARRISCNKLLIHQAESTHIFCRRCIFLRTLLQMAYLTLVITLYTIIHSFMIHSLWSARIVIYFTNSHKILLSGG